MNFIDSLIIIMLILIFNMAVFMLFKKYIYGKADAAMKFLSLNISKDLIWLIVSLIIIDKTKENFVFIVICFVIGSLLIYIPVIKLINKS